MKRGKEEEKEEDKEEKGKGTMREEMGNRKKYRIQEINTTK